MYACSRFQGAFEGEREREREGERLAIEASFRNPARYILGDSREKKSTLRARGLFRVQLRDLHLSVMTVKDTRESGEGEDYGNLLKLGHFP